ncbi:hypothetical protein [Nonomuraea sp. NPDC049624]|uniref:hypothetical protein n=1 Tax=unclassified Nonomuraea TaxID=2593643 RepID=UPI00343378A1
MSSIVMGHFYRLPPTFRTLGGKWGYERIKHASRRSSSRGRIGGWLRRSAAARRRVNTATGGIFVGLGVKLAVER